MLRTLASPRAGAGLFAAAAAAALAWGAQEGDRRPPGLRRAGMMMGTSADCKADGGEGGWERKRLWSAAPNPGEFSIEPLTQTRFPNGIARDATLFRLCALSVRVMMNLTWLERARAYAFGVYLSPLAIEALAKSSKDSASLVVLNPVPLSGALAVSSDFMASQSWTGARPGWVFRFGAQGQGYYRDSVTAKPRGPEVLVRLVMLRDVDGDHLARGFDKTITAREATLGRSIPSKHDLVHLFSSLQFIPKGTTFDFIRDDAGNLSVVANSSLLEVFKDPALAWALLDAFVTGPKAHLPASGKASLVGNASSVYEMRPLAEFET